MTDDVHMHEDDALAAEYVLHLLDAEARRAFEGRLLDEPALRALVYQWEEQLVPLADDIPEVTPPARLKEQVLKQVAPAAPAATSRFSFRSLFGGAFAGAAVAAVAAVVFFTQVPPQMPDPIYQAAIASEDGAIRVNAAYVEQGNQLQVTLAAGGPPPGRVLELWLIADGNPGPISLGVLAEAEENRLTLPAELAAQLAGGTLAISEEPPGGSPTGSPTGAVLAVGAVTDV